MEQTALFYLEYIKSRNEMLNKPEVLASDAKQSAINKILKQQIVENVKAKLDNYFKLKNSDYTMSKEFCRRITKEHDQINDLLNTNKADFNKFVFKDYLYIYEEWALEKE